MGITAYKPIFSKRREGTASSISSIHYGHYKAALEDEEDILITVNLVFMRVPFEHGFSLQHWCQSLHCTLQKKYLPYINKIRTIKLFEADFNTCLKCTLGRQLLRHSEHRSININQAHGSIPGRDINDANLTEKLVNDMIRLEKIQMISLFNDAAGCYDRICSSLNTITLRRLGYPKGTSVCLAQILNNMRHYIRTEFSMSK